MADFNCLRSDQKTQLENIQDFVYNDISLIN